MRLVSGLVSANHSDSGSFLVVHAWLSQEGVQRGGFWEVGRPYGLASPFDFSRILPVGGGLLVPCSLPGPPFVKQLLQMVTVVPGQGGQFRSAVPLTNPGAGYEERDIEIQRGKGLVTVETEIRVIQLQA